MRYTELMLNAISDKTEARERELVRAWAMLHLQRSRMSSVVRTLCVFSWLGCRDPEAWRSFYTIKEARLCPDREGVRAACDRVDRGIQGAVLDVRYSKEYAYYEVELTDGRRGWIQGGPEIELSR